ncbi:diguanylate cyclase [Pseudocolwellia agarivorans]|uniref:sensor domain-containing diguanylate cyclase n=1 Tax=Pseudocolwellia agarivorans TaxID=1911682 RepID=UPI003F884742
MNQKLALVAGIFCSFILIMFFIFMTEDVIGFHYADVKENILAYSYLIEPSNTTDALDKRGLLTDGLAIGSAFALTFSMLLIYLANGQRAVLLLSGYFLIRAIILTLLLGYVLEVGASRFYTLFDFDIPLLVILSKLMLMWFALLIFHIKKESKKTYWLIKSTSWALVLYLPVCFILPIEVSFKLSVFIELAVGLLLLAAAVQLIQKNQRLSVLFAAFVFAQLIIDLLKIIALFNLNTDVYQDSPYLYTSSFWLSGCFTVFMLSRGYYYQIQDKEIAEQRALASLQKSKKAQEDLLILKEENQEKLESRVQERTLELNIALQELEEANKELEEKNTLDELTGLYNRRYYDQKIVAEYRRSRRNLTPLSLVVIDIDHFKNVNDTHGHIVGDKCLVWVAKKIKDILGRVTDLGCRYGGEEFCLILPETDTKGAISLAETLRTSICSEIFVDGDQKIPITISCGISTYWQQPDITPTEIFDAADQALYKAKDNGRNQVQKKILTETIKS